MKKRAMLVVTLLLGSIVTLGAGASNTAAADVPCGTPAVAASDEVVHHAAVPAETHVVHHDAVPAVTHVVHHAGTPAVTHVEYLWSNPPGQGNDDNPGQGDENGREERWLPAGVDPPGNNKPGTPGAWVKIDERTVVDVPAVPGFDETVVDSERIPGYDETVIDRAGQDAYDETVHHAGTPAGAPCPPGKDPEPPVNEKPPVVSHEPPVTVLHPVLSTPVRHVPEVLTPAARPNTSPVTVVVPAAAPPAKHVAKAHKPKHVARVLPQTGAGDHTGLWLLAGLGLVLVASGGTLTARAVRR